MMCAFCDGTGPCCCRISTAQTQPGIANGHVKIVSWQSLQYHKTNAQTTSSIKRASWLTSTTPPLKLKMASACHRHACVTDQTTRHNTTEFHGCTLSIPSSHCPYHPLTVHTILSHSIPSSHCPYHPLMIIRTRASTLSISKWLVGSSKKMMCGLVSMSWANTTRAFCPPAVDGIRNNVWG